jgi:hypothetical protein
MTENAGIERPSILFRSPLERGGPNRGLKKKYSSRLTGQREK